jgi:hypothetical protein
VLGALVCDRAPTRQGGENALIGKTFVDGAIEINTIMLMGEQDGFDPPLAGRTKPLYDVELDFDYSYEEL